MQIPSPSVIAENAFTVGDIAIKTINEVLNSIIERLPNILAGFLILVIFWLFSKVLKKLFWSFSSRTKLDYRLRLLFSRLIFLTIFSVGFLTALVVVVPTLRFGDLITGLGFTSFIVGFATKDILNNLLSGILILWRQPFKIGDYVAVGSNQGKVEYIGIRATQLKKDDGELVLIPNGDMYSTALTIRSAGTEKRMVLKLVISYDADLLKAKKITEQAVSGVEGVSKERAVKVFVTSFLSEGVEITAFFWVRTEVFSTLQVFDECAVRVKENLEAVGIEIFPKQ
ncbi:MAG: mechanosensitive ion channel family protein [Pyrinomonadaceae bacterium]|nr:mechanosensitive ion channel family protein [Pyrinomonadaceae bacterium]MCX7640341.1 mechanosensitive ion channel family protein [Pyrinomonadaceae bacterium]MDW8304768.1 mechanosensitive ion channel family protein [Acidobacteriota bacterium]